MSGEQTQPTSQELLLFLADADKSQAERDRQTRRGHARAVSARSFSSAAFASGQFRSSQFAWSSAAAPRQPALAVPQSMASTPTALVGATSTLTQELLDSQVRLRLFDLMDHSISPPIQSTIPTIPTIPTISTIPTIPTISTIPTIQPTIPTIQPTIPTISTIRDTSKVNRRFVQPSHGGFRFSNWSFHKGDDAEDPIVSTPTAEPATPEQKTRPSAVSPTRSPAMVRALKRVSPEKLSQATTKKKKKKKKKKQRGVHDEQELTLTPEQMNSPCTRLLSDWRIPAHVIAAYARVGIVDLYDWQKECLGGYFAACDSGGAKNMVYAAPTSGGKTLVAELLMLRRLFETERRAILALPFVSLVDEKTRHLKRLLKPLKKKVRAYHGAASSSPWDSDLAVDIAVCTFEKANALLNRLINAEAVDTLGTVVVDEVHMLADGQRGHLIEALISKAAYLRGADVRIFAMSATLGSLDVFRTWIDAHVYRTDYRPVELVEYVYFHPGSELHRVHAPGQLHAERSLAASLGRGGLGACFDTSNDPARVGFFAAECVLRRQGVLIFCSTRDDTERTCQRVASSLHTYLIDDELRRLRDDMRQSAAALAVALREHGNGQLDAKLAEALSVGVAYHHAGLTVEERQAVEAAFRDGGVLVLAATSTLAAGVNLPARRVVFNGVKYLNHVSYRQMSGRAGRKGQDTIGESIVCAPSGQRHDVIRTVLTAGGQQQQQQLLFRDKDVSQELLERPILEVVVLRLACTAKQLTKYLARTLYGAEHASKVRQCAGDALAWLRRMQFVERLADRDDYQATPLGQATVASNLPPREALFLYQELSDAQRHGVVLDGDFHLIYLIAPVAHSLPVNWAEFRRWWVENETKVRQPRITAREKAIGRAVGISDMFMARTENSSSRAVTESPEYRKHSRFWAALVLHRLVLERPLAQLELDFGRHTRQRPLDRGTLQALQQSAQIRCGMICTFAQHLKWHIAVLLAQFSERLQFGVQADLLELMKLPVMTARRARVLYTAGMTDAAQLARSRPVDIYQKLLDKLPFVNASTSETELAVARSQLYRTARAIYLSACSALNVEPQHTDDHFDPLLLLSSSSSSSSSSSTTANVLPSVSQLSPDKFSFRVSAVQAGDVDAFALRWQQVDSFAWSLCPLDGRAEAVAVMWSDDEAHLLPLPDDVRSAAWSLFVRRVVGAAQQTVVVRAQDELVQLWRHVGDAAVDGTRLADPLVAHWLLTAAKPGGSLAALAKEHNVDEPAAAAAGQSARDQAVLRVCLARRLQRLFDGMLGAAELTDVYRRVEMPAVVAVARMTWRGWAVCPATLAALDRRLDALIAELRARAQQLAGCAFDPFSSSATADVLFGRLQLPVPEAARQGRALSSKKDVLRAVGHELADVVLLARKLRRLQKNSQTYSRAAAKEPDGRVRARFVGCTETGRLVFDSPNLLCVPNDVPAAGQLLSVRAAFVPAPGHCLASFDYAQVELRLMAHYSGDARLRAVFRGERDGQQPSQGQLKADVFNDVAGCWLDKSAADVSPAERRLAKELCYAVAYGMGARSLADRLAIAVDDAARRCEAFCRRFAGLVDWIDAERQSARRCGHVTTLAGRRRRIEQLGSKDAARAAEAERQAVNTKCQGSAADLIKQAMVRLASEQPQLRLLLQLHDELLLEVPADRLHQQCCAVVDAMQASYSDQLTVPLKVVVRIGPSWSSQALRRAEKVGQAFIFDSQSSN